MGDDTIISFKDVIFSFDGRPVLDHISLGINRGDYLGVIGPNGGGKTTMLRLMLGLIDAQAGTVRLFNRPVGDFKDWYKIGYVPQKATSFESRFPFTVEEVVTLGRIPRAGLFRRLGETDREAVEQALDQVHLLPQRKNLVAELSGGQQQRVFIAKGLVANPEVLILDEPTVGVDVESQDEFYHLLSRLNREHGITLIVVSHDIDVIANEVNSLACVNQTLTCHNDPAEFTKGEFVDKLYGHTRKLILHRH